MLKDRIMAARGITQPDLVLKDAKVLNMFTGEIIAGDVAIHGGAIAGIGVYNNAAEIVDLGGRYLSPGFINAHCHVESSMVSPADYCKEELRHGVTTVITDPHEVANVAGMEGIHYMLEASKGLPVNYYMQLPSCVPATGFEHAGAVLGAKDLEGLLSHPRVLGLGEMMNYPGVLQADPGVLEKIRMAGSKVVDGHAPGLSGLDLQAYAAAGVKTDHESTSFGEAAAKLRAGMAVLVREGSASRNLEAILQGVLESGTATWNMAFCSDDKHFSDLRREGTIRKCVQMAVSMGMEPMQAYAMATINAARIYGLKGLGAIAPGYCADLLVLDDLEEVSICRVYKGGKEVDLALLDTAPPPFTNTVNLPPLGLPSFKLPDWEGRRPVIHVVEGQITTEKRYIAAGEAATALATKGLLKVAVIERHRASGEMGVGLLSGYGLKSGAVATTVGHDSHNLLVAGASDADMLAAVKAVEAMQGGIAYVNHQKVAASVPLPLYGLMTTSKPEEFLLNLECLIQALHDAGVPPGIDPLITLSFLALPLIPEIRITDMGIFDVNQFRFLSSGQDPIKD